jgi:peptidyl-prolyl cis-trans isomerase B (cyclophilin B)
MKQIKYLSVLLIITALCLMLTTCGGGSGDAENGYETTNERTPETQTTQTSTETTGENANDYDPVMEVAPEIYTMFKKDFVMEQFMPMREGEQIAIVNTTMGEFRMRFFPQYAPNTVRNFITHAENGYFDGNIFHRVLEQFMVQTGDPTGTSMGGESIFGEPFPDEFDKNLRHFRGAVSMANSGPNTNGSQFFVVQRSLVEPEEEHYWESIRSELNEILGYFEGDPIRVEDLYPTEMIDKFLEVGGTMTLDFMHTVFAQVYYGMDVIDAIASVETKANPINPAEMSNPVDEVSIISITIDFYEQ